MSLTVGLLLAMPFFQLWRFITPGLQASPSATPSVRTGQHPAVRRRGGGGVTLPKAIGFLSSMGSEGIASFFQADRYLRFVLFMGPAFGLTFELLVLGCSCR